MKKDFWLKRWAQSEIGWHQTEVEPALIQWASGRRPGRILVPFCGKSLDLIWLKSQGHEVIGVELSELALKKFFSENAIASAQSSEGRFTVHRADGLTLFNGDFFDLTPEQLGSVDAVYDRAALIAQPPEMRNRYALKLRDLLGSSLAQPEFSFLQIVLERFPHDEDGPPFSVRLTELEHLYGHDFAIHRLSEEMVEARAPAGSSTHESVLILAPLQKT